MTMITDCILIYVFCLIFLFLLLQENGLGPIEIKRMKTDEEFMLGMVPGEGVLHKSDIKMEY